MGTRRERVVLELDDQFTGDLVRATAAAKLFQRELDKSSRSTNAFSKAATSAEGDVTRLSGTVNRSARDLDSYSGRLGLLASSIGALGPAAVPITAVAIPAVTGLASQLGFAALAGGTAVLAFQGVGDALTAMNKAHLEPTAANLEKAREAMERLSPAAQDLVRKIGSMREEFGRLKEAAGAGILPGATAALEELEHRLPIVERILRQISLATGDALREGAESLAGPEWDRFFHFIATEARPELTKFAKTVGNLAHGFAELWVAFGPLNSSFSSFLLDSARAFDDWATGLSATQGFQDFVTYLRDNGPKVADAVGSIANALVQIVEAAAPIGGPVLEAISTFADVIANIADSDLGTPIFGVIAAFSALSLATKAWSAVAGASVGKFIAGQAQARVALLATVSAQERASLSVGAMAKRQEASRRAMVGMGAQAAVLGLAVSGVTDKVGLSNTATLGLAGSMLGPWGAAAGASIGLVMDLTQANGSLTDAIDSATAATERSATAGGVSLAALKAQRDQLQQEIGSATDNFWFSAPDAWASITGKVGDAKDALAGVDRQIAIVDRQLAASRGENARYRNALGLTKRGFELLTKSGQDFMDAVADLDATLSRRASLRDYRQSLRDLRASIKENGKALNTGTAAADANQAALDTVVDRILKVAAGMKNIDKKKDFLKQARADLLATAGRLDGGKQAVERLTSSIDELDKKKAEPKIEVDSREAFAQLSVFEQKLAGLDGKEARTYIRTVHESIFGPSVTTPKNPQPGQGQGYGVVAPPRVADGGYINGPGSATSDSIPAWLSNGEFVVKAAAVDHYGADFLHRVNAMRYADGGRVERSRSVREHVSSSRRTASSGPQQLVVSGTLDTPWGPAHVRGIAEAAARDAISDSAALDRTHDRMYAGRDRG